MSTLMSSTSVEHSCSLFKTAGRSNKEYHLYVCRHLDGTYTVHAEYGRRGAPNQTHDKTPTRVPRGAAERLFHDLALEKRRDGYEDLPSRRAPERTPGSQQVSMGAVTEVLAAALQDVVDQSELLSEASSAALLAFSTRVSSTAARKLPLHHRQIIGAVLADIACREQDYVDDALRAFESGLSDPTLTPALISNLSDVLTQAFETARLQEAPLATPGMVLEHVFAPVRKILY
jgi:predicted DNA-binding WGR domain protein